MRDLPTLRRRFLSAAAVLVALLIPAHALSNPGEAANELAVSGQLLMPLNRPSLGVSFGFPAGPIELSGQLAFSYLSLKSNFSSAAESSQYASKLSNTGAFLTDLTLSLPEVSFSFLEHFFFSVAPTVRGNLITATYSTSADEPLIFRGFGLALGPTVSGGYQYELSSKLSIDFIAGILSPLWTMGGGTMDYSRNNSTLTPTLTETDLENMLEALEPYLQTVTKQTTAGVGLRLTYRH